MVHERALDVLIELMKKEQLDESVPLHGIEKGINHFEVLVRCSLIVNQSLFSLFRYPPFVNAHNEQQN